MTVSKVETNPPDFGDYTALHGLLRDAFAYMEARIDPPSSLHAMSPDDLAAQSAEMDLLLVRAAGQPVACLFGHSRPDCYYIGKLAVAAPQRSKGLARELINTAATRARALGHDVLELNTRVELVENHAAFARLGFHQSGVFTHPGYDRPTSLTFRRPL
ncbi:MAG: GNAT family N-acetyltransferase [Roseicyclus sp.]|jgi:GNAT superfamily N-acetyltransferase